MKPKDNSLDLKSEILKLKKASGAVILAHNYQIPQIQEIADFLGDSLELARISRDLKQGLIVFCGVKFMAETAKILSPHKKVLLPVLDAGCPLADTITVSDLLVLKKAHPNAWVVTYVNSSAEIKALSDVCCTSSNAIKVVKNVPVDEVIFVPDKNLAWWVQKNVPEKKIINWNGFCYVHEKFSLSDLEQAKMNYPSAVVIAHPEVRSEILERVDYVESTAGMVKRAKELDAKEFIIGTEIGMIQRLKKENPGKEFYSLGNARICLNMKKTTLKDLYDALSLMRYEINLSDEIISKSSKSLDAMVKWI